MRRRRSGNVLPPGFAMLNRPPWGPASGPVLVSYAVWPDRLLDIDPAQVRREGAAIDRAMFAKVLDAARPYLPEVR